VPILLPSYEDQIVIGRLLGALDDKLALNRRTNETLEAIARAIFKDWFVDFGPTFAKAERSPAYLASNLWALFPDRLGENGLPEGWKEQPLSAFFSIIGGGTPKTSVPAYWDGDIPWFSVVDTPINGNIFVIDTEKTLTKRGLEESSARMVPVGTTIISARGTVGNLAMAGREMAFNQSCYGLRGSNAVGDCFVFLAAQHMVAGLQAMAHGSVFSTITRQTFDALFLPLAGEQVLQMFEFAVGPLFEKIRANAAESRTLAETRDLLLPKLMSGEIRMRDAEKAVGGIV
jgi:type I restriction enzyme, S subunit